MKFILTIALMAVLVMGPMEKIDARSFEKPGKFSTELHFGLRLPIAETRDDVLSGFSLRAGLGFQLTQNWEIFHLAFDFGNSSPHDPEWIAIYDYSTSLQQEMINVYGFPLTTRFRFKIHEQLELYFGGGIAYYWFRTRLDHPYYGELKKSRQRNGPGGVFEAGIFSDAFGEKILVGLVGNLMFLRTHGETMTTPRDATEEELSQKVSRNDFYFSIGVSLRYFLGE